MAKFRHLFFYECAALTRGRWVWVFFVMYNLMLATLCYFANEQSQIVISVLNSVLYFNLISVLFFSTLSWNSSAEFISLVLSQPVSRAAVFSARLLSFVLYLGVLTGVSLFVQLTNLIGPVEFLQILQAQLLIQIISVGLGFCIAICIEDRLKAVSVVGLLVLLFVFALDAFDLWIIINFSAYPLEKILLMMGCLNPLTLVKYLHLLDGKNALWIGYAGLLLSRAWKEGAIQALSFVALSLWILVPIFVAWKKFQKKDL